MADKGALRADSMELYAEELAIDVSMDKLTLVLARVGTLSSVGSVSTAASASTLSTGSTISSASTWAPGEEARRG